MAKRARAKPRSQSFAGTGGTRPISIDGEKRLDDAVKEHTVAEQRISILEEENARLQIQLENKRVELERAEEKLREAEEEEKPSQRKNANSKPRRKNDE